jgi:hypothetical protein
MSRKQPKPFVDRRPTFAFDRRLSGDHRTMSANLKGAIGYLNPIFRLFDAAHDGANRGTSDERQKHDASDPVINPPSSSTGSCCRLAALRCLVHDLW